MVVHNYSNTASEATLDAPLNSSATTFAVSGFTGFPSSPFWLLMDRDTATSELMECTGVAGSTLTVVRGQGGTASTSHSAGAVVEHVIPASVPQAVEQHVEATSNIHGVTGSLVGADSPGTMTSKTYEGAHVHRYSASQPSSPTAGFLVDADNSISRDGFLAQGVGANADRRGFLLTQSGTPRIEGFYDGTLRVTPSGAAVRPGIESTTSIRTVDLDVTDDAVVGGDLQVTGTVQADAMSTGNLTTSGTLSVGGTTSLGTTNVSNLTTSGTAAVGGTLTAGRIVVPTASGAGTTTGQTRYRNSQLEVWDGTTWRGTRTLAYTQTSTTDPGVQVSGNYNIASLSIPDPGWPFRVLAQGSCELGLFAARWDMTVRIGSIVGTTIAAARPDDRGDSFGCQLVTPMGLSDTVTGATSIHMVVSYVSGGSADISGNFQTLTALVIPV